MLFRITSKEYTLERTTQETQELLLNLIYFYFHSVGVYLK